MVDLLVSIPLNLPHRLRFCDSHLTFLIALTNYLLFNPNSGTSPTFRFRRDLNINRAIYKSGKHIYVDKTEEGFSGIDFLGELFNMTRDSNLFINSQERQDEDNILLYEAKYIHQFDHRFASQNPSGKVEDCSIYCKSEPNFFIRSKSFVIKSEVSRRLARKNHTCQWLCGFRDIARATDERTAIFSIFPISAVGNSINLSLGLTALEAAYFIANTNSFVFDYACRQKVGGTHLNIWIVKQLPVINLTEYSDEVGWGKETLADWMLPRVLELTYTAWDLQPFAQDCGYDGAPFRWDEERRFLLCCELDAAYFHLYGIQRDDVDYILETFPIVKRKDEKAHGHYRTKDKILEIYDAMAEAMQERQPYQTLLDPPPADPSVAHPNVDH